MLQEIPGPRWPGYRVKHDPQLKLLTILLVLQRSFDLEGTVEVFKNIGFESRLIQFSCILYSFI
ncbi:hypothetical protein HanRHA438_Chr09g0411901 [Helianthus annuus]|nr:hypothetical protein HanRHA438_Chr09g0411901 [Helianthus annuus]